MTANPPARSLPEIHDTTWPVARTHAIAWGLFILTTAIMAGFYFAYRDVNVWAGWAESNSLRKPSYSERIYEASIFRTRANTWSNQAFMLAGTYALAFALQDLMRGRDPRRGYLVNTPAMSALFGLACCYLAVGSGLYHASLTRWGQQLDVASMYAPLAMFIAISIGTLVPRIGRMSTWPILGILTGVASVLFYVYKWQMSSGTVLPTLILVTGTGAFLCYLRNPRYQVRWFALGFGALVLAVYCRQTDVAGRFSGPDAWYQGHALWHVLNGVCLACTYVYFRSELARPPLNQAIEPTQA